MNRRQFLRSGTLLGGGVLLGGGRAGQLGAARAAVDASDAGLKAVQNRYPRAKLELSCAAYSFRKELQAGELTLAGFIDFCAAHDLEGTELTSYYFPETSRKFLCGLRRRAYVNGLAISGTPVGNNFCFPRGKERDEQLAHVKQWIDHVAVLGSQTIRIFAGRVSKGVTTETAAGWAIESMKEAAEYAGERGILLALENHGGITSTADQLLHLVRSVDSPWLGVNLDTGNFHTRPYEEMVKAAPYAVAVQVKVEVRSPQNKKVPTDFDRVVQILHAANYRGHVALEYEASAPATQAVPVYLRKLREAMARAAKSAGDR